MKKVNLLDVFLIAADRIERMHFHRPLKSRVADLEKGYKQTMAKTIEGKEFVGPLPPEMQGNMRWFEFFSEDTRKRHVDAFCRSVIRLAGQPCVVITYPRKGPLTGVYVRVYDLDAGTIYLTHTSNVLRAEKVRPAEESDFQYSAILSSDYTDEVTDICRIMFP